MRVSEERYERDLRRLQLAWRLVKLQARTPTIEAWTGLSIYRIRRLRRSYAAQIDTAALKGVTPFRIEYFFRSGTLRTEGALLAGLLEVYGVTSVPPTQAPNQVASLGRGERFRGGL